jgi:hypothetical protein
MMNTEMNNNEIKATLFLSISCGRYRGFISFCCYPMSLPIFKLYNGAVVYSRSALCKCSSDIICASVLVKCFVQVF